MEIRPALPSDTAEILRLLSSSLGWLPDEEHAAFFAWKHEQNPFGPSLAWVAEQRGQIIGFRTFLRWEFEREGEVVLAARAVDTATHPDHRGRGIFSALTLHALDELRSAGVAFVFNTPNSQSRPGYLKMGWKVWGRLPITARPGSLTAVARMTQARAPAQLWSTPTAVAVPAAEALADTVGVEELLAAQPSSSCLRTRRSPAYLLWRYGGLASLCYRAHLAQNAVSGGLAVFRLRRRGQALEAAVGELLVPGNDPSRARALARDVGRVSGADYVVASHPALGPRSAFLWLVRQGPVIICRGLDTHGSRSDVPTFDLTLGDVELL